MAERPKSRDDDDEGGGHGSSWRSAWNEAVEGIKPHRPVDPVQVTVMWQATCDSCGWHSPPSRPKSVVGEWARLHRVTCPLKPALIAGSDG